MVVDEQAQAAEARLAFEAPHEVVGQLDPLGRGPQHELARVQHEGPVGVVGDLHQFGEVLQVLLHVDDARGVVAEDAEEPVDGEVDRRRLDARLVEGVDLDAAVPEGFSDAAVGEDHGCAR